MQRFVSAVAGLILLATPAAASSGKQAAAAAAEAARAFQKYAAQSASAGKRMDLTSAPASNYFQRVYDVEAFGDLPPVKASDMAWLLDWFGAVRDANKVIVTFGVKSEADVARNLDQYEDQFAAATVFSHRMMPRLVKTMQAFYDSLSENERSSPVRREGLAKIRSAYVASVEGALGYIAAGGSRPSNLRSITASLRETTDAWVRLVTDEERARLVKIIMTARQNTQDDRSDDNLRVIAAALRKS